MLMEAPLEDAELHAINHTRQRMVKRAVRSLLEHGISDPLAREHIVAINAAQILSIMLVRGGWRTMPTN